MSEFVVDIEMSLTVKEVSNLTKLAKHQGKTLEETARDCMNDKIEELIDTIDVE